MRCEVTIGRIVAHPCGQRAGARCQGCGKIYCREHQGQGERCVVCAGTHRAPDTPELTLSMAELFFFSEEEQALFDPAAGEGHAALHHYDS